MSYLLSPAALYLQGELTDKLSNHIHCDVFEKVTRIEDLKTAESAEFQDELQVLQGEVSFRPVNLILFTGRTLSAAITVLGILSSLAEEGTHTQLLHRNGLYAQLYNTQSQRFLRQEVPEEAT